MGGGAWESLLMDDHVHEFLDLCTNVHALAEGHMGTLFNRTIMSDYGSENTFMPSRAVALFADRGLFVTLLAYALMGDDKLTSTPVPGMCPWCGKPGPFINLQMTCPEHGPY